MRRLLFAIVILCPVLARAQKLVAPADIPAVEARIGTLSGKRPLDCIVGRRSTEVDDAFRVKALYSVLIPLGQYPRGATPRWASIVRVEPDKQPGKAVYLSDSFGEDSENARVLDSVKRSDLIYSGHFWTGPGKFTVDWTVLDSEGRACKTKWRFSAHEAAGRMELSLPEGAVTEVSLRGLALDSGERAPVVSRLTILLDVTPQSAIAPRTLFVRNKSAESLGSIGSLSAVVRRIPAMSVRLVCFSLDRQSVVYRDDDFHSESLDSLQRLNDAISKVSFDTVDYGVVSKPQGHLDLLAQLINAEIRAAPSSAAVIFMGRQERFQDKLPPQAVQTSPSQPSFFYLRPENDSLDEDSVTLAMKAMKGNVVGYLSTPDLNQAIERIKKAITHGTD